MNIVVEVTPNDNFSLDEQLQRAIGPFASSAAAHVWIKANEAKLAEDDEKFDTRGSFYTVLEMDKP